MTVYNSTAMRIIVNNLVSILETSNQKLKNILEKKYKKKVEGYKFVSSYKSGFWDGCKKFFEKKTGKFGTGLLSYIKEDLIITGLEYTIEDNRKSIPLSNYSLSSIKYREYQKLLIDKALKERGCILQAPTGSGKTIILYRIGNI